MTSLLLLLAAAPTFSQTGGYYSDPITLEITAAEGAAIHYTLDGSVPTWRITT